MLASGIVRSKLVTIRKMRSVYGIYTYTQIRLRGIGWEWVINVYDTYYVIFEYFDSTGYGKQIDHDKIESQWDMIESVMWGCCLHNKPIEYRDTRERLTGYYLP